MIFVLHNLTTRAGNLHHQAQHLRCCQVEPHLSKVLKPPSTAVRQLPTHSCIMSRSTIINEVSKSVTGTFAIHDFLSISTVSGSIDITINPQPTSPSSNTPAQLQLDTVSGSIRVTMAPFLCDPHTVIPERIFDSAIKSMSGSISAVLIQ